VQSADVVKLVSYSGEFQGEGQGKSVFKTSTLRRPMNKIFLIALITAALGTASHLLAADKIADDTSAPWKFSTEVKIDGPSRDFEQMTKLEIERATELAKHPLSQGHVYSDVRIMFVKLRFDSYDQSVAFPKLSHFQFGYGDMYPTDDEFHTSTNGAGWETPNVAFIKFCKDF
jgi:hypothetical protein